MLIADALDAFITSRKAKGVSARTIEGYRYEIPHLLLGPVSKAGLKDLSEITTDHIQASMAAAYDRGVSNHTLKSYRIKIAAFVNWASDIGYCQPEIMSNVGRVRAGQFVRRTYTEDELLALLEFARLRPIPYWATFDVAVIMLLADTGMRVGELVNLTIGDITDRGVIKVKGKGQKERLVSASPATLAAVRAHLEQRGHFRPSEPLFINRDGLPATTHGLYQRLRKMGKRIGIMVNPHKFRHSFAKMALENGANVKTLQLFLGHSQLQTTDNYLSGFGAEQAIRDHENFSPVRRMMQH